MKLSVLLLAVVILLIFLHFTYVLAPIENFFIRLFSPLNAGIYSLGAGANELYSNKFNLGEIKSENEKLKESLVQLTTENAGLRLRLQENEEQAKQCRFLDQAKLDFVPARIIGKNPEPNLQSIILDKGTNDGVVAGLPVVSDLGVIVGKIYRAKGASSEAILINDSRSQIAALILNGNNSKGVVAGEHGLSLKMELIPLNEKVSQEDIVVTSGIESLIPRGLVIGKINRVISEPNTFFQTAYLQPLIKLDNLTVVSIIKSQFHD